MSTLIIDELRTTLEQEFTVVTRREVLTVRPNLMFYNDPAGTFTMTIKQGSTTIIAKSLTMTEILTGTSWTANQYHYGVINFEFATPVALLVDTTYTAVLSSSGYVFSESSYLGWVKSYTNHLNTVAGATSSDLENPFDVEIWDYKIWS